MISMNGSGAIWKFFFKHEYKTFVGIPDLEPIHNNGVDMVPAAGGIAVTPTMRKRQEP
jgi:hypothetical protein